MDEKSALNGTTNATKNQEWKTKKGYGPSLVVAVSLALLLGLSFYAGRQVGGGGTNFPRGELGMTNAVASSSSSSSMSLVGSGTAKSSAYCNKNTGYNCGAVFPPDGNTCSQKGCCCHQDNGGGYKLNTCDNAKGYAYRGCNSCWGTYACYQTSNINVGTSSCHGQETCRKVSDSIIGNDSCHGSNACKSVQSSIIHDGSCHGGYPCYEMKNATIGKGSCNYIDDDDRSFSCEHVANVKIGNNSCNGRGVCKECKHNVPDNACNTGITDDMDSNGYCNYCL